MIDTHTIQEITFDQEDIVLKIDGKVIRLAIDKVSLKLQAANEFQRQIFKVSPSGYGINWPLIDEDLSVEALLKMSK